MASRDFSDFDAHHGAMLTACSAAADVIHSHAILGETDGDSTYVYARAISDLWLRAERVGVSLDEVLAMALDEHTQRIETSPHVELRASALLDAIDGSQGTS